MKNLFHDYALHGFYSHVLGTKNTGVKYKV